MGNILDHLTLEAGQGDANNVDVAMNVDTGQPVEMDEMAVSAEGTMFSQRYMANNGPLRPAHAGVKTMTKAQLGEQKMREAQGYPSNEDESAKVKELETKVNQMATGIDAILAKLGGPSSPASPVLASPNPEVSPSHGGPPGSWPIRMSEPQSLSPTVQPESTPLSDGRTVRTLSLGPASSTETLEMSQVPESPQVVETPPEPSDIWTDEPDPVAEMRDEQLEPVTETRNDPKTERVQILVEQVYEFLGTHDVDRTWRRILSKGFHRHIGFGAWPRAFRGEFKKRFEGFLKDSQFVTEICRKVLNTEYGPALGVGHVATFVVGTAGFTAFALSGIGVGD